MSGLHHPSALGALSGWRSVAALLATSVLDSSPAFAVPAWRFPYLSSEPVPGRLASSVIDGGLADQVLGASVYAIWGDSLYGETGGYRSLSGSSLDDVNIDDEAGKLKGLGSPEIPR